MKYLELAEKKLMKNKDITICCVLKQDNEPGVIYQGSFYSDSRLEDHIGKSAYLIEIKGGVFIFDSDKKWILWCKKGILL